MTKIRPFILLFAVVASAFLAYGLWTLPSPKGADYEGFSSARVAEDIKVISQKHHSVAHPQEREEVRNYLVERLQGLGADTVMLMRYDSLKGPQNKHVEYTFDAVNIVAEFAPVATSSDAAPSPASVASSDSTSAPSSSSSSSSVAVSDSPTWLMLVAHYDSRYSQPMPRDTVWSYGAADDGYGLGVILESVSLAMKDRQNWKQGVKVLFTDAEEVGMMGMKAAWENDKAIFDNVGLVLNVEARGPWGPALLFEACPGNDKVQDLYASVAKYPYTYSLTTVVYGFMPVFTDFSAIKDSVPGLNFSTIADINHYHTDKDNFSNISEKSIQHYGEQILPIIMEYLVGEQYADKDYLRSDNDKVNFTIPLLGIFSFSKIGYMIVNVVVFVLFLLLFALEGVRGRVKAAKVAVTSLKVLGGALLALAAGEAFAYGCASAVGAKFKLFGTVQGVPFDNKAMILFMVLLLAACVLIYLAGRKKASMAVSGSMRASAVQNAIASKALTTLYGTLTLMFVISAALLFAIGENLMFFITLTFASAGLILWRLTSLKVWLLAAIVAILLHAFSFLYALAMALTIGALGAYALIALIDIMVLIPLADLYLMSPKKK